MVGNRRYLLVTAALAVFGGGAHAEPPPGDSAEQSDPPFDSNVWDLSFCTAGNRWCEPAADAGLHDFSPDAAEFSSRPSSDTSASENPSPLGEDEINYREDSLRARIESIDDLPFVTVWKNEKARLFVGVDDKGRPGIHLAPTNR